MLTVPYLRLLARNRFRIHPLRWAMATIIFFVSMMVSVFVFVQWIFLGRKIARTTISEPPIFVVGHWRSGTTLLHELLSLDPQHAFPSTYECFAPQHFLITSWIIPKLFWFVVPASRPMDAMAAGFDAPQEDEFALVSMGAPSPYYKMAFCNEPRPYEEFYDMDAAKPVDVQKFDSCLTYFFKALTYKKKKRLILKSPTHTGRVGHLAKMFPGAKFVHISRNPCNQILSTTRTWKTLDPIQGFQFPKYSDEAIMGHTLDVFQKMYGGYFHQIKQLSPGDLCEVRFEDLIANPETEVSRIYSTLDITGFEKLAPRIREYFEKRSGYERRNYDLPADIRSQIEENCTEYMQRYGYL